MRSRRSAIVTLSFALLAIALAACSGAGKSASTGAPARGGTDQALRGAVADSVGAPAAVPAPAMRPGFPQTANGALSAAKQAAGSGAGTTGAVTNAVNGAIPNGPTAPGFPDRIVKTAEISLEVKAGTFDQAWGKVAQAAVRFGGYIASSSRGQSTEKQARPYGAITVRVPSSRFEDAMVALRGYGTVKSDSSSSEDVTQEYTDIESRLRNLRAQQVVLLRLMDKARSISDSIAVQNNLSSVQGSIEELVGRQNVLRSLSDMSTITVNIAEPGAVSPVAVSHSKLHKAWNTAVGGLTGAGVVLMVAAIWAVPVGLVAMLGMALARRTRHRTPATSA